MPPHLAFYQLHGSMPLGHDRGSCETQERPKPCTCCCRQNKLLHNVSISGITPVEQCVCTVSDHVRGSTSCDSVFVAINTVKDIGEATFIRSEHNNLSASRLATSVATIAKQRFVSHSHSQLVFIIVSLAPHHHVCNHSSLAPAPIVRHLSACCR